MTNEKVMFDEATLKLLVEEAVELAVQREREAIAKMVEPWLLHEYVEKIRNREQV